LSNGYGRAVLPKLTHIDCWIFDLDNTLYPSSADLFALIDARMGAYIQTLLGCDAVEAKRVQKAHFREHGTTLSGLMASHDVDPKHFLDFVHDIPMNRLSPDPALAASLARLPGRKLIYTNGDAHYAGRVLAALGLGESFEAIHDIYGSDLLPKPDPRSYTMMCDALKVDPARALFVEDMARNLKPAKALGMATVWVNNGSEYGHAEACDSFIDHEIAHVGDWLNDILGETV
jgi:putative hydrolase of the HAD superfamily